MIFDRSAARPYQAAAWTLIEHTARQVRRQASRLVLHAGAQAHQHTTGRPHQQLTHPEVTA